MKRINFAPLGLPQMFGLALAAALVVGIVWATAAHAQRPADVQYGEPKAPSGPALGASGMSAGGDKSGGTGAKAGSDTKTGGLKSGKLPATGGPSLLAYVGVLTAAGTGLALLRHRSGRDR